MDSSTNNYKYYIEGNTNTKKWNGDSDPSHSVYKAIDVTFYIWGDYDSCWHHTSLSFQSSTNSCYPELDYSGNVPDCLYPSIGDCYLILSYLNNDGTIPSGGSILIARVTDCGNNQANVNWISSEKIKVPRKKNAAIHKITNKLRYEGNGKFRFGWDSMWTNVFTTKEFTSARGEVGGNTGHSTRIIACCFVLGRFNGEGPVKNRYFTSGLADSSKFYKSLTSYN